MNKARKVQCLHCWRIVLDSEVLCVTCLREMEDGKRSRLQRNEERELARRIMKKKREELREFASQQDGLS